MNLRANGHRPYALGLMTSVLALIAGCRYERSICDESPGSGCSACMAECAHATPRAECEDACRHGEWTIGWPPQLP